MRIEQIMARLKELESLPQGPERWGKQLALQSQAADTPEYNDYFKAVVEEGVGQYGEDTRNLWMCFSYEAEFVKGLSALECIEEQVDSMR